MARRGLPAGGMGPTQSSGQFYPARMSQDPNQPSLADLQPFVAPKNLDYDWAVRRAFGANRGSAKYERLAAGYGDDEEVARAMGLPFGVAGTYYAPQNESAYDVPAVFDLDNDAVKLTDVPTSSTNYSRPRTVAAGYDPERGTMTVVFRDGTFYNYYQVSDTEWEAFSASFSKGRPWLNRKGKMQANDGLFIGKPRGQADVSEIDPRIREQLYRVVRAQQMVQQPRAHKIARNNPLDPTRGRKVSNYAQKRRRG